MVFHSFDFSSTCLSSASRQQLNNILKALKPGSKAAESRSSLLRLIERNAFDPTRGLYIPVTKDLWLKGKFPIHSESLLPTAFPSEPFPLPYFTNALTIPEGWGTDSFDAESVFCPKDRVTNVGFLVVTIEFDCRTTEELEECLSWTRGGGDFENSQFARVDRELTRFSDYRGYTIVFTGNRSFHFHFLFSTQHLANAPCGCAAEPRLTHPQAAIMREAHDSYWDKALATFRLILEPSLSPDMNLRRLTQWRRSPWGVRELEKDSEVIGLAKGTFIPQLVIHENIRTRSCRNCEEFLVSAEFEASQQSPIRTRSKQAPITVEDHQELVGKIIEVCRNEWGAEYPKPTNPRIDNGQWIVNFYNHPEDRKPSTILMGDFNRLYVRGQNSFQQDFYLPNGMSADELCGSLIGNIEDTATIKAFQSRSHSLGA